jgi:aryl-alcohol dehydrogenase-like predicted oxidoreductase
MIPKQPFGRTGHESARVIFGAYALSQATRAQADKALALLQEHGVNHVDTAPMYGKAEERLGPWMEEHRKEFFLATKTRQRTREGAMKNLKRSLERLRVDSIDLWQLHGLTGEGGWEKALGPGGATDALREAREEGLVRYLGVTGHGVKAPEMHLRSLEAFDFDSVMLPYNHVMMQNPKYAESFAELEKVCRKRNVALQTIKAVARRPWGDRRHTHNTYFYEPLATQDSIDTAVHWVLGHPTTFLVTAGDLRILPRILQAAGGHTDRPSDADMAALAEKASVEPVFK